jgi:hypothetical protein
VPIGLKPRAGEYFGLFVGFLVYFSEALVLIGGFYA